MEGLNFDENLKRTLSRLKYVVIFEACLVLISCFFVFALIFVLFGISLYFATVPAIIAFVIYLFVSPKRAVIRRIEEANPNLSEKLSAAIDNRDPKNVIARDLERDVTFELSVSRSDAFLDLKKTQKLVMACVIILFLLITLIFAERALGIFGFSGAGGLFGSGGNQGEGDGSGGGGGGDEGEGEESPMDQEMQIGKGEIDDIFGEESVAILTEDGREIELHTEYGEGLGSSDNTMSEMKLRQIATGEIGSSAVSSYEENIPVEMEEVVRDYFELLSAD